MDKQRLKLWNNETIWQFVKRTKGYHAAFENIKSALQEHAKSTGLNSPSLEIINALQAEKDYYSHGCHINQIALEIKNKQNEFNIEKAIKPVQQFKKLYGDLLFFPIPPIDKIPENIIETCIYSPVHIVEGKVFPGDEFPEKIIPTYHVGILSFQINFQFSNEEILKLLLDKENLYTLLNQYRALANKEQSTAPQKNKKDNEKPNMLVAQIINSGAISKTFSDRTDLEPYLYCRISSMLCHSIS